MTYQLEWRHRYADGDDHERRPHRRRNLFTVVLNPSTGAYTVTLLDNVLHAGGPNDEAARCDSGLTYTVTDADGSTATSTLTITFDDDAPTATTEASQNVAEGATVTGTLDFVQGADGATVTHIGGTSLVFGDDNYSQVIDIGDGSHQGEGGRVVLVHGGPGDGARCRWRRRVHGDGWRWRHGDGDGRTSRSRTPTRRAAQRCGCG